jgi:hypothetical protein
MYVAAPPIILSVLPKGVSMASKATLPITSKLMTAKVHYCKSQNSKFQIPIFTTYKALRLGGLYGYTTVSFSQYPEKVRILKVQISTFIFDQHLSLYLLFEFVFVPIANGMSLIIYFCSHEFE